ncbi:proprotein convertase subtilisin/kexin type 5-like [Hemiscyllium ocellatum]|uniref:proprotein convertase subtilisin/kexin type 5-like n=1 Tax=Hemiscyllium ocellatum TaxID=170820 RepID=UPI0029677268|nr:proprotein convertase subtilisin/kexin type 5-like [Hemiscyllium ocellatum]
MVCLEAGNNDVLVSTECSRYFFFHNGTCVQDCPRGFFQNTQTFTCTSCHPECSVCDGPDSDDCEGCANPSLIIHDGQCLKFCPEGTYTDKETEECQECHKTCRTCEGPDSTDCVYCRDGMIKNRQGHCVMHKDCALNMYMDKICKPCHKKCYRCYGPTEHDCLSCNHNHFLLNTTCVDTCPDGYYTDQNRRQCFACHKSCEICNGRSSTQCLTCKANWYRLNLMCVKTCGSGHFANESSGVCENCHASCKECWGPGETECLSCQDNNFLMKSENKCFPSCPEQYYENKWEQACERCHPSCKTCDGKGPIRCTSCYWGFQMYGSICSSQCFAGEYLLSEDPETQCEKCHDTCLECKGPGPNNCTDCHLGLLINLADGKCLNCCKSALPDFEDCCDCDMSFDECVLRKAVVVPDETGGGKPALFAVVSVLLIMGIGIGIFLLLKTRSKSKPINRGKYEKLPNQAKSIPVYNASKDSVSFRETQATEYKDHQDEIYDEEDDDDIVYMGQDGTVYRKFKYGLLDDDDDDELEYDDESYSFR